MNTVNKIEKIVRCPVCRKTIFQDVILRARFTKFEQGVAHAKCSVCKTWVVIPFIKINN